LRPTEPPPPPGSTDPSLDRSDALVRPNDQPPATGSIPEQSGGPGTPETDAGAGAAGTSSADQREGPWAFWRSLLLYVAVMLGVRQFLLEARYIPSGSMLPGLQLQDRLLVEKLSYRFRLPRRTEIVVFHAPQHFDPVLTSQGRPTPLQCLVVNIPFIGTLPGVQQPACDAFIKRVIGLPGDRVSVDPRGRVRINGLPLNEPYVRHFCPVDSQGQGPCRPLDAVVPAGSVLVLGDNRANSWDARFWPGGPFLPRNEIIGRAFWRFLPFSSWGALGPTSPSGR